MKSACVGILSIIARGIQVDHLRNRLSNPSASSSMMSEISPNNCSTFLFLSVSSESLTSFAGTAAVTYRIWSGKQKQNPVTYNDNSRYL